MGRLDGRVALITGAGRGIGRASARVLAKEGADIAIAEIDPATAASAAKEVEQLGRRSLAIPGDVALADFCEEAVQRTVDELGRLDILINNAAATAGMKPFEQFTDDEFMRTYAVNAMATFRLMRAASPHLRKSPAGRVINFASGAGTSGNRNQFDYAAAKESVRAMTRVAAREFGPDGVTVNTVCPLANSEGVQQHLDDRMIEMMRRSVPLGRIGDPESDIARAVLFLASDDSAYVTAHTLWLDGGSGSVRA
jgi:NAD(P)-dependent dehydrogenase (short-subunit alcohol dehydrogenase family)